MRQGLIRSIEVDSSPSCAAQALDRAVKCGRGAYRVSKKYGATATSTWTWWSSASSTSTASSSTRSRKSRIGPTASGAFCSPTCPTPSIAAGGGL